MADEKTEALLSVDGLEIQGLVLDSGELSIARQECADRLTEMLASSPLRAKFLSKATPLTISDVDAGDIDLPAGKRVGLILGRALARKILPDVSKQIDAHVKDAPPSVGLNLARDNAAEIAAFARTVQTEPEKVSPQEIEKLKQAAEEGIESLRFKEELAKVEADHSQALVITNNGLVKSLNDDKSGVGYSLGCKITDYLNVKARELVDAKSMKLLVLNYKNVALKTQLTPEQFDKAYMVKLRDEYVKFIAGQAGTAESRTIGDIMVERTRAANRAEARDILATKVAAGFTFGYARGEGADVKANSAAILARADENKYDSTKDKGFVEFEPKLFHQIALDVNSRLVKLRERMGKQYFEDGDPPVPKLDVVDWVRKYGDPEKSKDIPDPKIRDNLEDLKEVIREANVLDYPLISMHKDESLVREAQPIHQSIQHVDASGGAAVVSTEERIELARALQLYFTTIQPHDAENKGAQSKEAFFAKLSEPETKKKFKKPILGTVDVVGLGSINVQETIRGIQQPGFIAATGATKPTAEQQSTLGSASKKALQRGSAVKDNLRREVTGYLAKQLGGDDKYLFYVSGGDEFFYICDASGRAKLANMQPAVRQALASRGEEGDIRNAFIAMGTPTGGMLAKDLSQADVERANAYLDKAIAAIKAREKKDEDKKAGFMQTASLDRVYAKDGRIVADLTVFYSTEPLKRSIKGVVLEAEKASA